MIDQYMTEALGGEYAAAVRLAREARRQAFAQLGRTVIEAVKWLAKRAAASFAEMRRISGTQPA